MGGASASHGLSIRETDLDSPQKVRGVGKFPQTISTEALVPGQFEDGDIMDFTTAIVPESPLPALWGLDSMERLHDVVDTRSSERKMYLGSDTVITPGRNTKILQMYPAESGHLMIPITHYRTNSRTKTPTPRAVAKPQPKRTIHFHEHSKPVAKDEDASTPTPAIAAKPLTTFQ